MYYSETDSAMFHPNNWILKEINNVKHHIYGKDISMTLWFQNLLGNFEE